MKSQLFKENEFLELKKSTSELKEAIISIASILNKHKFGKLYFGIKNNGEILGQQISEKTIRDISLAISENIEPKIYPKIKEIKLESKKCISIEFEGIDIPYLAFGRAYIRIGDCDKKLSAKELENMFMRKNAVKFDSKISDTKIDKTEELTLKEYIQKGNLAKRINFKYTNKKTVLEKLHLAKNNKLTNAGKLLFSKQEPIEVQAAIFAGKDKLNFLDIKQFKGNIFQLLKTCELYIKENIRWRAKLVTSTREEIPEIPFRAISEALVNSFCHRDYQAPESNKVAIYSDRIEIWNPGEFPEGFTPQDFIKKDLPSILRNPEIGNCLYLSADIEKWGSGLKRIYEACREDNVSVEFLPLKYGFTIKFIRPEKTVEKTREKTREKIFNLINENPKITAKQLSVILNISSRAVEKNISELKIKNKIRRIGSKKNGTWKIS
ncbi:MAG: RNA-binding domain-containing protein [archaeon]